jgi:hypothetical protein
VKKVEPERGGGRYVVVAAWQPQVIFSVMFGGLGALLLVSGLLRHRVDWLLGAAIFGMLWAGFIAWFRGFKLELTEEDLWYTAPLSRRKRLPLTTIQGAHFRRVVVGPRLRSTGFQAVVIDLAGPPKSAVVVNARVFPDHGLKQLFDALAARGIPVKK